MDINRNNYETFFLLYLDRELSPANMLEVEGFLSENADLQKEFALLQQTFFVPSEITFPQKESLYRREEKRRVVPFYRMKMAAAVAVLIFGCWLLISRSLKSNEAGTEQARHVLSAQKMPSAEIRKEEKSNQETLSDAKSRKQQPQAVNNDAGLKKESIRNSGTAGAPLKSKTMFPEKNQQPTVGNHDEQMAGSEGTSVEPPLAVKNPATSELQSEENPGDGNPKQVAAVGAAKATALVFASAETTDQMKYEETVLKENEYPTDNAISVVSLNNNKGISGFLKKITKRTPADDQSRKLRVSVFQISY